MAVIKDTIPFSVCVPCVMPAEIYASYYFNKYYNCLYISDDMHLCFINDGDLFV